MFKFWERDEASGETLDAFASRLNHDVDAFRDANLVVNLGAPIPGQNLTVWAQIGGDEPVVDPRSGAMVGKQFKDLSEADVAKKIDARKAALARGRAPSPILRPVE